MDPDPTPGPARGTGGGMVGQMAKSDETLFKLAQHSKYTYGEDDFVRHCRDVVRLATIARATQHATNFVLYMSIQPPARNILGDLVPGSGDYATMSTQDYIDCLALRLGIVEETKVARKECYLLQQDGRGLRRSSSVRRCRPKITLSPLSAEI